MSAVISGKGLTVIPMLGKYSAHAHVRVESFLFYGDKNVQFLKK